MLALQRGKVPISEAAGVTVAKKCGVQFRGRLQASDRVRVRIRVRVRVVRSRQVNYINVRSVMIVTK